MLPPVLAQSKFAITRYTSDNKLTAGPPPAGMAPFFRTLLLASKSCTWDTRCQLCAKKSKLDTLYNFTLYNK